MMQIVVFSLGKKLVGKWRGLPSGRESNLIRCGRSNMILYYGCRGKSGDVREKVGKVVVGIWGVRRGIAEN